MLGKWVRKDDDCIMAAAVSSHWMRDSTPGGRRPNNRFVSARERVDLTKRGEGGEKERETHDGLDNSTVTKDRGMNMMFGR